MTREELAELAHNKLPLVVDQQHSTEALHSSK
jgi:hypothetical protein